MADPSLSNEMATIPDGCPANKMAGELNQLIKKFGHDNVQKAAMLVIGSLTLDAHVMETHPKEYMSLPMEDVPQELRDSVSGKRKRAAELKEGIRHFKRALAETGLNSN